MKYLLSILGRIRTRSCLDKCPIGCRRTLSAGTWLHPFKDSQIFKEFTMAEERILVDKALFTRVWFLGQFYIKSNTTNNMAPKIFESSQSYSKKSNSYYPAYETFVWLRGPKTLDQSASKGFNDRLCEILIGDIISGIWSIFIGYGQGPLEN